MHRTSGSRLKAASRSRSTCVALYPARLILFSRRFAFFSLEARMRSSTSPLWAVVRRALLFTAPFCQALEKQSLNQPMPDVPSATVFAYFSFTKPSSSPLHIRFPTQNTQNGVRSWFRWAKRVATCPSVKVWRRIAASANSTLPSNS